MRVAWQELQIPGVHLCPEFFLESHSCSRIFVRLNVVMHLLLVNRDLMADL